MAGNAIETLARRFPQHGPTIRRLEARDANFRSICDDYAEVERALEHWEAARPAVPGRAAEYRQMLEELEAEALVILKVWGRVMQLGGSVSGSERVQGGSASGNSTMAVEGDLLTEAAVILPPPMPRPGGWRASRSSCPARRSRAWGLIRSWTS